MSRQANATGNPRTLLLFIMIAIFGAVVCFAIYRLMIRPPSNEGENTPADQVAGQPAQLENCNGETRFVIVPDGTNLTTCFLFETEVRTLRERPFEPAQPEIVQDPLPTDTPIVVEVQPNPPTLVPFPTDTPVPVVIPPPETVNTGSAIIEIDYQVQQGDTLYGIAANHNSSVGLMAQYNLDASDLVPGQIIRIPIANPNFCGGYRAYVVREGDTAYSIARRFGTTHEVLQQINGLDANYNIRFGGVLCIP